VRVISIVAHNGAEECIIVANGPEVTALEDAIYRRALEFERNDELRTRHGEMITRMLDDVRRPYEATR
jgi:hypothetical protein